MKGHSFDTNGVVPTLDITEPATDVHIEIDQNRKVLYVHLEGGTVLRICRWNECHVSYFLP